MMPSNYGYDGTTAVTWGGTDSSTPTISNFSTTVGQMYLAKIYSDEFITIKYYEPIYGHREINRDDKLIKYFIKLAKIFKSQIWKHLYYIDKYDSIKYIQPIYLINNSQAYCRSHLKNKRIWTCKNFKRIKK